MGVVGMAHLQRRGRNNTPAGMWWGRHTCGGLGGDSTPAGTWQGVVWIGGQSSVVSPAEPSPAGGHTAAVGSQPGGAADPAHGLHPHPMRPRALRDPQPPLLPPVTPGLTLALRIFHHLTGGLASHLLPLLYL